MEVSRNLRATLGENWLPRFNYLLDEYYFSERVVRAGPNREEFRNQEISDKTSFRLVRVSRQKCLKEASETNGGLIKKIRSWFGKQ
jgi:hypothetical protein